MQLALRKGDCPGDLDPVLCNPIGSKLSPNGGRREHHRNPSRRRSQDPTVGSERKGAIPEERQSFL